MKYKHNFLHSLEVPTKKENTANKSLPAKLLYTFFLYSKYSLPDAQDWTDQITNHDRFGLNGS